jgi:hypothetical protein
MNLRRRGRFCALAVAIAVCFSGLLFLAPRPTAQEQRFTFGLIGDLGYFPEHEPWVNNVFADLNKDTSLSFVAHVGDLSRPIFACTDEMVARRLSQFNASIHPLIYTPGDNEWTDCHEKQGVKGGSPQESLAKLRPLFFPDDRSLGKKKIALVRQSQGSNPIFAKYRENARWEIGGVTFITIHVVGSNNGLGRTPEADEEYAERNKANLAWLRESFEHATRNGSRAVMIITQANIFPAYPPSAPERNPSGFTDVRAAVAKETREFGKNVVLVHGDSHYFRIDNPLHQRPKQGTPGEPAIGNFLRVETFGTPNHHWLHVTVDAANPNVFIFSPRIVATNLPERP